MELIDLAKIADDADRFDLYLAKLCDELEFDFASYATANPVTGDVQGYATYPADWVAHYTRSGHHRYDPTLHQSARSIAPVDWSRFQRDRGFDTVFEDAKAFGISPRGLTVPVRGPYGDCGLLSVTRDCSDSEWRSLKTKHIGELQMAAVHIHDHVMRSGQLQQALGRPCLSSREIEILQWCALGRTHQDIADILSISHRTVEVHLRSARTKLAALTTAQAVGRGIALGMIEPG